MKAILVLDEMPKSCTDCRLKRGLYCGGENSNSLYNYIQYYDSINDKPSWCPLKPMTDAIPISFLKDKIDLNESWGCYGYAKGLQSAIDEWEKQNE